MLGAVAAGAGMQFRELHSGLSPCRASDYNPGGASAAHWA